MALRRSWPFVENENDHGNGTIIRMLISVIIPTLNRTDYLRQCLAALGAEIGSRSDAEIIVVDDGSLPGAREKNRALCAAQGVIYLLQEKNRGMAVARNAGIKQAQGSWIVFIDDDICVDTRWGAALRDLLGRLPGDVAGIEGKVVGMGGGVWDREVQVQGGGLYLTCHIAYKRDLLLKAGCFDEQFEHEGPFHEDQELGVRVRNLGRIIFEPSFVAFHLPRRVKLLRYVRDAPARIEKMLKADFYFYTKHPGRYHDFRHAKTFWGTYAAVLFKYPYVTFKRRNARQILSHPLQVLALAVACVVSQLRAWTLLPYFIGRATRLKKPTIVWFAAAIPAGSRGGVMRLMTGLADGLRKKNYAPELIFCAKDPGPAGYLWFSLRLALKLALQLHNPPRWIIARSTDAFFSCVLRKLLPVKTRIILHNHGWEEQVYEVQKGIPALEVAHPVSWKARLLRFPLLRATLAMADYCLCGTIADMRWIRDRYSWSTKKLRYVPNGVTEQPVRLRTEQAEWSPDFLYVGTLTWRKNIRYAFLLFRLVSVSFPRARLYLVGTGAMPALGLTEEEKDRVFIESSVAMEEMRQWYERCPFFIHTARYEGGHSLALLEAMSYGAVPFVSPIPSNREIVVPGRNGVVLDGADVQKDAATVIAVMADKDLLARLSRGAWRTAMRNRWERQVLRMERVLSA
ncbi:MAG: glycosyltransferase [Chitinispirillaceae bacterium]|nr:glycosyltransferase [Chitinispirillaceae bacterium]